MQPRPRVPAVEPKSPVVNRPSVFSPPPTEEEEATAPRARIPSGLFQLLILALAFFLIVAGGSFIWLLLDNRTPSADIAPASTTVLPTAAPSDSETPSAELVFPVSADGKVSVQLVANEHAWISVSADANIIFQGIADPNQIIEATADEILIVATGNGGAFQLYLNGADWGLLGDQGEVVRRAWNPTSEVPLEG